MSLYFMGLIMWDVKVGVLRASHKIFLSLTGKFEWKFENLNENFPASIYVLLKPFMQIHANSPVRLKKSLWDSRTTATLVQ
jgi:hypothetical protein